MVLRMDMLMTFFIVLSLYTFFRMYKGIAAPRERWLLPVYIFMALFTKGPYGVMIPLASIAAFLAWKRELRMFGRYFGWRQLGILVLLCAIWWGGFTPRVVRNTSPTCCSVRRSVAASIRSITRHRYGSTSCACRS